MSEQVRVRRRGSLGNCAYCKDTVELPERVACARCLALHHAPCWEEHGACAACAAVEVLRSQLPTGEEEDQQQEDDAPPLNSMMFIRPMLHERKNRRSSRPRTGSRFRSNLLLWVCAALAALFLLWRGLSR